ncbi:uncharacterized protein LOC120415711 isoform X2 [Culex pipiens pallens]|uniref:uncharacterized protein LOC120415711 isoform X2 n=1 Tax=Culex pipiens pallens TaxID=42434 RepID=UPI001953B25B|nr:uncharacterized protein LOC120415711 isoform X2 [Culex pipiens pallens]
MGQAAKHKPIKHVIGRNAKRWTTPHLDSMSSGDKTAVYGSQMQREFDKHLHRSDCWRRFWGFVPSGRSSSGGHSAQVDSRGEDRWTRRTSGGTRIRSRDVPARCATLEISQTDDPSTLHRSQRLYPGGPAADVTEHEKDLYNTKNIAAAVPAIKATPPSSPTANTGTQVMGSNMPVAAPTASGNLLPRGHRGRPDQKKTTRSNLHKSMAKHI